jgi:hypothetical protein
VKSAVVGEGIPAEEEAASTPSLPKREKRGGNKRTKDVLDESIIIRLSKKTSRYVLEGIQLKYFF